MTVKSTPYFRVFSVGRNEHKFVICLRVKVFTCNILIEYSVVHPEGTLKHDHSTKIRTLFFMDSHSVRHFRPTFYLVVQIICNNSWFVLFSIIFCPNSNFLFHNFLSIPSDTKIKWSFGANFRGESKFLNLEHLAGPIIWVINVKYVADLNQYVF